MKKSREFERHLKLFEESIRHSFKEREDKLTKERDELQRKLDVAISALSDIANFKMNSIDKTYLIIQSEGFQERAKDALDKITKEKK